MTRAWLVALAACGAPAQQTWIERQVHEQHGAPPIPGDLANVVDPTGIETLPEAAAVAAFERSGDRPGAARLALRLARLAHHRGDEAEARAWLARAVTAVDHGDVADQVTALTAELAAPPVDPAAIAVLLPLTGRYAAIGSELRAAIELAPAEGTRWLFIDTRGEPEGATAAVDIAVNKGAVAILGGAGTREAIAAARAAVAHQVPIALLAPADGADPQSGVFRLVDSPADEARAVAKLAADDGFPTVGVLAPRDDTGEEAADAFVAEATRLGLGVTGRGAYDPTGGDLEPDVKQFLGLVPASNPRLAEHLRKDPKHGWQTFSPDVAFSLLYIPDRYDRAALVAAFLPYLGVELRSGETTDPARLARKHGGRVPSVVQLVGGAGWHHPSLPIRGGAAVQGALIVDSFAGELGGDIAASFSTAFTQRMARAPTAAAAEAYDAATLVAQVRHEVASASDPRGAFRAGLAHARLDDGACGPAAIAPDGEIRREPSVLEVQGDELIVAP